MEGRRTRSGVIQASRPTHTKRSIASGKPNSKPKGSTVENVEESAMGDGVKIEVVAEIHAAHSPDPGEVTTKDSVDDKADVDTVVDNMEEKPADNSVNGQDVTKVNVLIKVESVCGPTEHSQEPLESEECKAETAVSDMTEVEVMLPEARSIEEAMDEPLPAAASQSNPQEEAMDINEGEKTVNEQVEGQADDQALEPTIGSAPTVLQDMDNNAEQAELSPKVTTSDIEYVGHDKPDTDTQSSQKSKSEEPRRYGKVEALSKEDLYNLCQQCGKGFLNIADLQSHLKADHNNVLQYRCLLCHMSYLIKEKALAHSLAEHQDTDGIYIQRTNNCPAHKKDTETYISARPKKRGLGGVPEEFFPYTLEKDEVPVKVEMEDRKRKRFSSANNNHKSMFASSVIPTEDQPEGSKPYKFVGKTYESKKKQSQTMVISPAHIIQGKKTSRQSPTPRYSPFKVPQKTKDGIVLSPVRMFEDVTDTNTPVIPEEPEQKPEEIVTQEEAIESTENPTAVKAEDETLGQVETTEEKNVEVPEGEILTTTGEEEKENASVNESASEVVTEEKTEVDNDVSMESEPEAAAPEEAINVCVFSDSDGEDKVPGFSSRNQKHIVWRYAMKCAGRFGKKPEIKCRMCRTICPTKNSFYSHIALNHRTLVPWNCDHCDYSTRWVTSLRVHLRRKHPNYTMESCHCGQKFKAIEELREHQKEHVSVNCTACKRTFSTQFAYNEHYQQAHTHSKVKYSCPACQQCYSSKMECMLHIQQKHLGKSKAAATTVFFPTATSELTCTVCDEKSKTPKLLSEHMKKHGLLRYCGTCKKNFNSDDEFKVHLESHSKEDKRAEFNCSNCGNGYKTVDQLTAHFESMHRLKIYTCVKCQKKFDDKQGFQAHIASNHQEDIMFRCSLCPNILFRAFSTAQQHYQEKHAKNTEATKPAAPSPHPAEATTPPAPTRTLYRCAECQQCFQTAAACIHHQRIHTENLPRVPASAVATQQIKAASKHRRAGKSLLTQYAVPQLLQPTVAAAAPDTDLQSPLRMALLAPRATIGKKPATSSSSSVHSSSRAAAISQASSGGTNLVQIFMCERCHSYFPNANSLALHVLQSHSNIQPAAKKTQNSRLPAILQRSSTNQQQQVQQAQPATAQQQYAIDGKGNVVRIQGNPQLYDEQSMGGQNLILQQGDGDGSFAGQGQVLITGPNNGEQNQQWVVNQQELGQYLLADNRAAETSQEVEWVVESIEEPSTAAVPSEYYAVGSAAHTEYYADGSVPSSTAGAEYYTTAPAGTEYYAEAPAASTSAAQEYYSTENLNATTVSQAEYNSMKEEPGFHNGLVKAEGEQSYEFEPKLENSENLQEENADFGFKIASVVGDSEQQFQQCKAEEEESLETQEQYAVTQPGTEQTEVQQLLQDAISAQGLQDLVQVDVTPKTSAEQQQQVASSIDDPPVLTDPSSTEASVAETAWTAAQVSTTAEPALTSVQQLSSVADPNVSDRMDTSITQMSSSVEAGEAVQPGNQEMRELPTSQAAELSALEDIPSTDGYNATPLQQDSQLATDTLPDSTAEHHDASDSQSSLGEKISVQSAVDLQEPTSQSTVEGDVQDGEITDVSADFLQMSSAHDVTAGLQSSHQDVMAAFQQQAAEIKQEMEGTSQLQGNAPEAVSNAENLPGELQQEFQPSAQDAESEYQLHAQVQQDATGQFSEPSLGQNMAGELQEPQVPQVEPEGAENLEHTAPVSQIEQAADVSQIEQGLQALQEQLYQQAGVEQQQQQQQQQQDGEMGSTDNTSQEVDFQPQESQYSEAQGEAAQHAETPGGGEEEQVVMQVEVPVGHTLVQFDGNIDPAILEHAVSQINGPNGELYLVVPENILYSASTEAQT